MSLQEIKNKALEEARVRRAERTEKAQIAKYNNADYVDTLIAKEIRVANISTLEGIVTNLDDIETIKINGLGKISVNCYPVSTGIFGAEVGSLLGIADTLSKLFLEDQVVEAYSIAKTTPVAVEDLSTALGKPQYFNKNNGELVEAVAGDYTKAVVALEDFANELGIEHPTMAKFTKEAYTRWFKAEESKSQIKKDAYDKSLEIDNAYEVTITDDSAEITDEVEEEVVPANN